MDVGDKLNKTIMSWGVLGITVVIVSVILLKFKDTSGVTSALNTTIDSFVSGFSEPRNWVTIVIIAVVGFSLLWMFKGKFGRE